MQQSLNVAVHTNKYNQKNSLQYKDQFIICNYSLHHQWLSRDRLSFEKKIFD